MRQQYKKSTPLPVASSMAMNDSTAALRQTLLFLAFIEGAAVMSVEILGAKMLAPFFGSSLIVWTSVIAITLLSMTAGYFAGGILSKKINLLKILYYLLLSSGLLIGFMRPWSHVLFNMLSDTGIYSGSIIGSLLIIGPPLVCLSSTTPVIIKLLAADVNFAGKSTGTVYSVSTAGGILMTLLTGFFIVPVIGISVPLMIMAAVLIASGFWMTGYMREKKIAVTVAAAVIFVFQFGSIFTGDGKKSSAAAVQVPYITEGLMGQLKVVDRRDQKQNLPLRHLLINGIPQTRIVNDDYAISYWKYVHLMAVYASLKHGSPSVLLCGFGGGSIGTELSRMNMKIDAVEIDGRMLDIAKEYFHVRDTSITFITDDARHYLRTTGKKYDLLVFDLLNGEVQPSYVFTVESFSEMKKILNPGGMILIEFQEFIMGGNLYVYKSIFNTMRAAGFHAYHSPAYDKQDDLRDIILIGATDEIDFTKLNPELMTPCCRFQPWLKEVIANPVEAVSGSFADAPLLTDDSPLLEHLKTETQKVWREKMRNDYTKIELNEGRKLFK